MMRLKGGFFLLCLFAASLCLALGVWQLHRYQDKKNLLLQYHDRLQTMPKSITQLTGPVNAMEFQPIYVKGHYVNELTMVIQNRFHEHQVGFEVITPFQVNGDKRVLLVNRGWTQQITKDFLWANKNNTEIKGYIKLFDKHQFILGENILNPTVSPIVIQKIDSNEISHLFHQSLYPFVLRLDVHEPYGFARDWVITAVQPERHMGYAIQWFVMGIVLCIAYLGFCRTRKRVEHEKK